MPEPKLSPAQRRGVIVDYLSRDEEPTTTRVIWIFALGGIHECSIGTIERDLNVLCDARLVERVGGIGPTRWKAANA